MAEAIRQARAKGLGRARMALTDGACQVGARRVANLGGQSR
jgi:hypothetical protein